jgi:hypothetical protein
MQPDLKRGFCASIFSTEWTPSPNEIDCPPAPLRSRKHTNAFIIPADNLDTSLEAQSNISPAILVHPYLLHRGRQAIQPRVIQRLVELRC